MYRPHHVGGGAAASALASTGSHTVQMLLLALLFSVSGVLLMRISRLRRGND